MRILFFGDSITDANRARDCQGNFCATYGFGAGYVNAVVSQLAGINPNKYQAINAGISGNRIVDLYARIKTDCWNYKPDVLSILIGVNDVWHEIFYNNGVELDRFEKVYRMIIEDTLKLFPNVKIMLLEPFVQKGSVTEERYERFLDTLNYAKVVEKLAREYNLVFVPLQEKLDAFALKFGLEKCLIDGVHPAMGGAKVIADEWLKAFSEKIDR